MISLTERTDSSCQAGPVSQNQIRQCEHDIEFGSLLFEPSVSCFSETQLFLDDTKYVLYFRADRGLCPSDKVVGTAYFVGGGGSLQLPTAYFAETAEGGIQQLWNGFGHGDVAGSL